MKSSTLRRCCRESDLAPKGEPFRSKGGQFIEQTEQFTERVGQEVPKLVDVYIMLTSY